MCAGLVLQPARQVEEGGETQEPEEAGGQLLGGACGGARLGGKRRLHARIPRHPWSRPHPRARVQAAFQHRLQLDVSLHPAAKLHGGRLQVINTRHLDHVDHILRDQVSLHRHELAELDVALLPPVEGLGRHGLQLLLHVPSRLAVLALLLRPELRCGLAVSGLWPQLSHGLVWILPHFFILELGLRLRHRYDLRTSIMKISSKTDNNSGILGPGMSMPLQVPSQSSDIASNYWPRLQ